MKKKVIKLTIVGIVIAIIAVFLVLIYKTLFSSSNNTRNKDITNYKLTNNEINAVKDKIGEVEEVKNIDIHTNKNSKIIKIIVTLTSDVDFGRMRNIANESLTEFSEENLINYDFEFYIDSENAESEVYPKIGYKFKDNSEFSW